MRTKQAEKAEQIRQSALDRIDKIRSNGNLSDRGRLAQIDAVHRAASADLQKLQSDEQAALAARRSELVRSAFGTAGSGSDLISFRDASDRASGLQKEADALELLNRALVTGDTSLASAVAQRAADRGWGDAFEVWGNAHPQHAAAVDELAEIDSYASTFNAFTAAATFKLGTPSEIKNASSMTLREVRGDAEAANHTQQQANADQWQQNVGSQYGATA